ncbi:hypothetical protein AB1Y20_015007 [Prymnesium parvum]|uniref:Uncharacterized protein n=1 Tax=Prymnesium parvum TaxID=97485 RepID=A0AB34JVH6_PRYPA
MSDAEVAALYQTLRVVGARFDIGPHLADGRAAYDYRFVDGPMAAMGGHVHRGHIGGDKFSAATPTNRTAFYARHLARYYASAAPFTLLEIGVFRGESLAAWDGAFARVRLVGVDGNLRPFRAHVGTLRARGAFAARTPRLLEGDSRDAAGPVTRVPAGSVDVIVDDGCHLAACQAATCALWMRVLARAGLYVIEDVSDVQALLDALGDALPGAWVAVGSDEAQRLPLLVFRSYAALLAAPHVAARRGGGGARRVACELRVRRGCEAHPRAAARGWFGAPGGGTLGACRRRHAAWGRQCGGGTRVDMRFHTSARDYLVHLGAGAQRGRGA